jgi:hypothetical protein
VTNGVNGGTFSPWTSLFLSDLTRFFGRAPEFELIGRRCDVVTNSFLLNFINLEHLFQSHTQLFISLHDLKALFTFRDSTIVMENLNIDNSLPNETAPSHTNGLKKSNNSNAEDVAPAVSLRNGPVGDMDVDKLNTNGLKRKGRSSQTNGKSYREASSESDDDKPLVRPAIPRSRMSC